MLRTVHPHVLSLLKKYQIQTCTAIAIQHSRTLTTEPAATLPKVERPLNVKAIIEAAVCCGVSSSNMEVVLVTYPHLVKFKPQTWTFVLKTLIEYGFSVENTLNMLTECPDILQIKREILLDTLQAWQECHFGEDLLMELLKCHPSLLLVDKVVITNQVTKLVPYFEGRKRVGKLIGFAPTVILENWDTLFKKLEYLHSLHTDPSVIASTGVLSYDLKHIKMRHEFLHRAGLYKMPTKNYKKSLDKNNKLHSIVNTTDQSFAVNIAGLSLLEYEVFKDMYELEYVDNEDCDSDTDSDDE